MGTGLKEIGTVDKKTWSADLADPKPAFDAPADAPADVSWGSSGSGPVAAAPPPAAPEAPQPASAGTPAPAEQGAPSTPAQQVVTSLGVAPLSVQWPTNKPQSTTYAPQMEALKAAPDATAYAAAKDQLARTLAANLTAAGHEVTWKGDQMIVDGRTYDVAPKKTDAAAAANTAASAADVAAATAATTARTTAAAAVPPAPTGRTTPYDPAAGWEASKLNDPTQGTTEKYLFGRAIQDFLKGQPISSFRGNLQPLVDYYNQTTGKHATVVDDDHVMLDGHLIDIINADGSLQYLVDDGGGAAGAGGGAAATWGGTPMPKPNDLGGAGVGGGTLMDRTVAGTGLGQGSRYTPTLMDEHNPQLEALATRLAEHPEAVSQHDIDMMEAKDAEEQIAAQQSGDEAARRFGFQGGISDSPWLASERASSARAADQGILSNRRNIELTAATANHGALVQAVGTLTSVWNQTQSVHALNESIKQNAAQLGLSEDEFIAQLQQHVLDMEQQQQQFNATFQQHDDQFGADLALQYDQLNNGAYNAYWPGGA